MIIGAAHISFSHKKLLVFFFFFFSEKKSFEKTCFSSLENHKTFIVAVLLTTLKKFLTRTKTSSTSVCHDFWFRDKEVREVE